LPQRGCCAYSEGVETQDILSAAEAAATLGVSAGRVYALIRAHRLPARKISRAWVIARADLARVAERRPERRPRASGRERSPGHASTDPTRGEEVPRPSEELFQGVFDQMAVGLALTALDGRLVAVNQTLCRMLGYTLVSCMICKRDPGPPLPREGGVRARPTRGCPPRSLVDWH